MSQPLRIVVCDDSVDVARTLALLLEMEGHEVRVVHSGLAVLEAAQRQPPDVVLLDLGLASAPDGVETARRLRRDLGLTDALLVAVTGASGDEDRRRTREAGFDLHLVKPAEPAELLEALQRAQRRP